MSILITGGAGYIGSHAVVEFLEKEEDIIIVDNFSNSSPEVLDKIRLEILDVLSKYVEIENEDVDITVTKSNAIEGESPSLVANIPIKNIKGKAR